MELIQAAHATLLPQQTASACWDGPLLTPPTLDSATPCLYPALLNATWGTNGTDPGDGAPGLLPTVAGFVIAVLYAAVCVVGLLGNTLVIYVVLRYARAESATNLYILNLAVADELFMLGLPFLAAQNALLSWPFGALMCRVVMTVDAINQFTSTFCLTVMSLDRYLAVAHPIRSAGWRRPRVAKAVNATVWAVSFVVVLPVVAFAGVLKDDGNCSIVWPEPAEVWKASFIVYTSTVGFFCPLLVICLCYLLIVVKVRSAGKRVRATSPRRRKSERKITRMVVVVVAVFVLCWLPFYVLNIVNLLVVLPGYLRGVYFFVVVLSYANSCANPILYGFLSDNFKRGFRKALCRSSRRVENQGRASVGAQRPTEEWAGVALQPRNGHKAAAVDAQRQAYDEAQREEEEEKEKEEMGRAYYDGAQMSHARSRTTREREEAGAEEDTRTKTSPGVEPEPARLGRTPKYGQESAFGPAVAGSSLANEVQMSSNNSSPLQEEMDMDATLEVSYL